MGTDSMLPGRSRYLASVFPALRCRKLSGKELGMCEWRRVHMVWDGHVPQGLIKYPGYFIKKNFKEKGRIWAHNSRLQTITAGEPRQEPEEITHGPHSQKRGEDVARSLFMVSSNSDVLFMI